MDDQPRCYADIGNDNVCMEPVETLGHRCPAHTWAEPPLARVILNPEVPVPPVHRARPARRAQPPPPDHRRCVGIKRDGERCLHKRKLDSDCCGIHQARVPVQVCTGTRSDGERCKKPGRINGLCGVHERTRIKNEIRASNFAWQPFDMVEFRGIMAAKKIEQRVRQRRLDDMNRQLTIQPTLALQVECDNLQMEYDGIRHQLLRLRNVVERNLMRLPAEPIVGNIDDVSARARERVEAVIRDIDEAEGLRRRLIELRVGHIDRNLHPLGAFANDRQNVHTTETNIMLRAVNTQLETVSPIADPLRDISWEWNNVNLGTAQQQNSVRADMQHWYDTEHVTVAGDFAYKNMLDRVWGLINASRHRADMIVRLWEECVDALGMCAAGHLTRLANAVQGFDENAPILEESRSERLQNAMAQISQLDPGERESAARRIFAELGVEGDAQTPWLEALL